MKLSSKARKLSKEIYKACLTDKQEIDEKRLQGFLSLLKKDTKEVNQEILQGLYLLVKRHEKEKQLFVETPYPLTSEMEDKLKKRFENLLNKELELVVAENKNLIAGLKITNGDNVWENTIESSLNQLKGNI